jgi:hypothetical protein
MFVGWLVSDQSIVHLNYTVHQIRARRATVFSPHLAEYFFAMKLSLMAQMMLLSTAFALVPDAPKHDAGRRQFLTKTTAATITAAASTASSTFGWMMKGTSSANAYERRDVGVGLDGFKPSAETAAYNLQAYETNNRLEKAGFKLETAKEQSESLTAALSGLTFDEPKKDAKKTKKVTRK